MPEPNLIRETRLTLAEFLDSPDVAASANRVALTDLRPWHVSMGGWHWWECAAAINHHDRRSVLPPALFAIMWDQHPDGQREWDGVRHVEFEPDDLREQPALDALSAACVAYVAALPPWWER